MYVLREQGGPDPLDTPLETQSYIPCRSEPLRHLALLIASDVTCKLLERRRATELMTVYPLKICCWGLPTWT
jgi:hypothetical protein